MAAITNTPLSPKNSLLLLFRIKIFKIQIININESSWKFPYRKIIIKNNKVNFPTCKLIPSNIFKAFKINKKQIIVNTYENDSNSNWKSIVEE